ncbi:hypothetical protein AGMMS49975_28690 [Clostridia bacterium]|nr:hypothetical protein AGMMS49975_28690 [Clostridia bacterium]
MSTGSEIDSSNIINTINQNESNIKPLENEVSDDSTYTAGKNDSNSAENIGLSKPFVENNTAKYSVDLRGKIVRAAGNQTPDDAIFIDDTLLDEYLTDYIIGDG